MPVPFPEYRFSDPVLNAVYEETLALMKLSVAQAVLTEQKVPGFRVKLPQSVSAEMAPGKTVTSGSVATVVIEERFRHLHPERRKIAADNVKWMVRRDPALLQKVATAHIDPASHASVMEQVNLKREFDFAARARPRSISRVMMRPEGNSSWYQDLIDRLVDHGGLPPPPPAPDKTNKQVCYEVASVYCNDETGGNWFTERGSDEINMGGTTVDSAGATTKVPEFRVGGFDDHDQKTFAPPRVFHTFDAGGNYDAPRTWTAFVVLAEKDAGGFATFLQKLYDAIKVQLMAIIQSVSIAAGAWVGGQIGGSIGSAVAGPLGTAIGAIAGALLGALVGWIINAFSDDIFAPQATTVALPSLTATFANGALVSPFVGLHFVGHNGEYTVAGRWRIIR